MLRAGGKRKGRRPRQGQQSSSQGSLDPPSLGQGTHSPGGEEASQPGPLHLLWKLTHSPCKSTTSGAGVSVSLRGMFAELGGSFPGIPPGSSSPGAKGPSWEPRRDNLTEMHRGLDSEPGFKTLPVRKQIRGPWDQL